MAIDFAVYNVHNSDYLLQIIYKLLQDQKSSNDLCNFSELQSLKLEFARRTQKFFSSNLQNTEVLLEQFRSKSEATTNWHLQSQLVTHTARFGDLQIAESFGETPNRSNISLGAEEDEF